MSDFLSNEQLEGLDAYWRASNYLAVGQIYLKDNPLLKVPLTLGHIKPRLLGHWGTTPGLNLIGRGFGATYIRTGDTFDMVRPRWQD